MSNIHLYCTVDRSDRDPGPRDSNRFRENIRSSVRYQGWTDIEICMITCAICHFTHTVQKRFCILELIVRFLLQCFHHVSLLSHWNHKVILCCSIVNSVYSSVLFCHYTTIILQTFIDSLKYLAYVHCSKWRDFLSNLMVFHLLFHSLMMVVLNGYLLYSSLFSTVILKSTPLGNITWKGRDGKASTSPTPNQRTGTGAAMRIRMGMGTEPYRKATSLGNMNIKSRGTYVRVKD